MYFTVYKDLKKNCYKAAYMNRNEGTKVVTGAVPFQEVHYCTFWFQYMKPKNILAKHV